MRSGSSSARTVSTQGPAALTTTLACTSTISSRRTSRSVTLIDTPVDPVKARDGHIVAHQRALAPRGEKGLKREPGVVGPAIVVVAGTAEALGTKSRLEVERRPSRQAACVA